MSLGSIGSALTEAWKRLLGSRGDGKYPRLLRVLSSNEQSWHRGLTERVDVLARETFSAEDGPVSVFLAESDEQEVAVAAALTLERNASKKDPAYLLRIAPKMLRSESMTVESTEGSTGIPEIDVLHRDLVASADSYRVLAERLVEQQHQGRDLVRIIKGNVLSPYYEQLSMRGDLGSKLKRKAAEYSKHAKGR